MLWQHDDDFLPNHTALGIIHIVNLVENHKLDIANQVGSLVKHASQDFGCHDETASLGIDLDIACQDTDSGRVECLLKVSELLV